jgi:hypothetical protein
MVAGRDRSTTARAQGVVFSTVPLGALRQRVVSNRCRNGLATTRPPSRWRPTCISWTTATPTPTPWTRPGPRRGALPGVHRGYTRTPKTTEATTTPKRPKTRDQRDKRQSHLSRPKAPSWIIIRVSGVRVPPRHRTVASNRGRAATFFTGGERVEVGGGLRATWSSGSRDERQGATESAPRRRNRPRRSRSNWRGTTYSPALLDRATVLRLWIRELFGAIPARQPADDPAQHEPRLRREGEIGGHADDDAERQAQHPSERDRGSDAHTRESMRGVAARGDRAPAMGRWCSPSRASDKAGCLAGPSAEKPRIGPLTPRAVRGLRGNAIA